MQISKFQIPIQFIIHISCSPILLFESMQENKKCISELNLQTHIYQKFHVFSHESRIEDNDRIHNLKNKKIYELFSEYVR